MPSSQSSTTVGGNRIVELLAKKLLLDGEINVSVLDEADPSFGQALRKDLWGEHCGKVPGPECDPLLPLNKALGIWRDSWGTRAVWPRGSNGQ